MFSSPSKASKITGVGPIFAGPSGYFAYEVFLFRGQVEGFLEDIFPMSVFAFP